MPKAAFVIGFKGTDGFNGILAEILGVNIGVQVEIGPFKIETQLNPTSDCC